MDESKGGSLNKRDFKNQGRAALKWLAPLGLMYITQLTGYLQVNKFFQLSDLIPTQMTLGGIELYVVNQLYGLLIRWQKGE